MEPGSGSWREYSTLSELEEASNVTIRGTGGWKSIAGTEFPALFTVTQQGIEYALLSGADEPINHSFVEIKGTVTCRELSPGKIGQKYAMPFVSVTSVNILRHLNGIVAKTKEYWQIHRSEFQAGSQKGSKLKLPQHPPWRLLVDEKAKKAIVSCENSDAMWEWNFDFVYNLTSLQPEAVYSHQWFKGE